MIVKTKKILNNRIIKVEANAEIKEVLINTNIMDIKNEKVQVCFRGSNNSGIIELSAKEAHELYKTINDKLSLVKQVKIIKEKKLFK
jgi:hypothetical protein